MKTASEEWFVFLNFAKENIGLASRTLGYAREDYPAFVQYCLLRDAVITYSRPFKNANARLHPRGIKLPESFIPPAQLELHKKIVEYRDKVFAHTDLKVIFPKLFRTSSEDDSDLAYIFTPFDREPLHLKINELDLLFKSVALEVDSQLIAAKVAIQEDQQL
jgi:hypothetical protein